MATPAPLFRFLQVNDTHYQSPQFRSTRPYRHANGRVHWLFDALRGGGVFPELDFLLLVGDMTNTEDASELAAFKLLLDGVGLPYHTVIGNHENRQGEGHPGREEAYREVFGERFHYAFSHRGLGFVIVDNSGTGEPDLPPAAVEKRDRLLLEHLNAYNDRPVVVACHVPVVAMREEPVLIESFGFVSHKVIEPGMAEILSAHRHHVVAVLSGHLHLSGVVREPGIAHIDVCGTASFPHDVALHTVYADALETRLIQLPSDLLTPATNIHGAPRFGRDFTDAKHPDYLSYLMGTAAERSLRLPFGENLRVGN